MGQGRCPVLTWQSKARPQTLPWSVSLGAESPKSGRSQAATPPQVLLRVQRVGKYNVTSEMRFHEPHGLAGTRVGPLTYQPWCMFHLHRVKNRHFTSQVYTGHGARGEGLSVTSQLEQYTPPPRTAGGKDAEAGRTRATGTLPRGWREGPRRGPLEKTRLADIS